MDFTQYANVKLFSNFRIIFQISYNFLNNSGIGFMQARWGEAFLLYSMAF